MISVLYVDDEPTLLDIGRIFLERSGDFCVKTLTSAQEALDSPDLRSCDAIISDYQMPGMDGIAFLKIVREQSGDIPFIIFTGRGREEIVIEAINNGADFYVQKGGDPEVQFAELAHKIRQAVRRKQAERSLHDSERRLADIIDFLPDAMIAVDRSGRVIAWNRVTEDLTGVPASEMLGKGDCEYALSPYGKRRPFLFDMLSEPDEKIQEYYTHIVHDGRAISAETSLAAPKGRHIDIMIKASPLYNQKGEVTGAIEVVRDITALKKTGQDLRAAYEHVTLTEEELRSQFDELRVTNDQLTAAKEELHRQVERLALAQSIGRSGSWEYNIVTGAFWLSAEGSRLLGYPAVDGEIPIEKIDACIPDPVSVRREMTGLIAEGKEYNLEYTINPADGSPPRVIHSVGRLEKDGSGRPVRVIGIAQDITERRKADDEIAFKNSILLTQQETSPDGILIVDETGKILSYNKRFTEIWKIPRELVEPGLDEPVLRQVTGQLVDPEEFLARVRYLYEHKDEKSFEELALRDGRVLERFSSPVFGENKKYYGRIWYFRDITERMHADKALEQSRERYRLMLMNVKDGIMVNELTPKGPGQFIEVNDTSCRILGMTREEIQNLSLVDLDTDEMKQRAPGIMADLRKNRHAVFQTLYRAKTGEEKILDISVSISELDGRPTMLSIVRDITGQVATEQALRESEEKYRALVETLPDLIWEIDRSGKFRYVSPRVGTILGYSPDEVVGKTVLDLSSEQERALAARELEQLLSSDPPLAPFEISTRHRDGHDMVVEILASRVTDADGNLTGFRGVARDITDRRRAADAIRRANRQLNLLGSITRHDALNKITGILGYLRLASQKCNDPDALAFLKKAESSVVALRSQIEFTRIYQDLGSREPLWIELDAVMPRSQVPKTITFGADIQGICLYADAILEKVFTNLLDNSVRHGEHVTEIRVFSRREGTALVVVFEDNGTGIAAAEKERIFERGFGKNTGLGLFLVREILELTGITIRETGVPGSGARFEIVIPEGVYRLAGTS